MLIANFRPLFPRWMDITTAAYSDKYTFRLSIFCIVYSILILTSHLWIHFLISFPSPYDSHQTKEYIYQATGTNYDQCDVSQNSFCFIQNRSVLLKSELFDYQHLLRHVNYSENDDGDFTSLVDSEEKHYHQFSIIKTRIGTTSPVINEEEEEEEVNIQYVVQKYIADEDLYQLMEYIKTMETKHVSNGYLCVCPSFLNIMSNVTFLFDRSTNSWIIMHQPFIHRNNTLSDLVVSTVKYSENSYFYKRNKDVQDLFNLQKLVHLDSFIVEYTDVIRRGHTRNNTDSYRYFNKDELEDINEQLVDFYSSYEMLHIKRPLLFYKKERLEKKRIQLIGNDATCFIYCNSINENLLSK